MASPTRPLRPPGFGPAAPPRTKGQVLAANHLYFQLFNRLIRRRDLPLDKARKLLVMWTMVHKQRPQNNFIAELVNEEKIHDDSFGRIIGVGQAILACLLHCDDALFQDILLKLKVSANDMIKVVSSAKMRDAIIPGMAAVVRSGIPRLIFDTALRGYQFPPDPADISASHYLGTPFEPWAEPSTREERTLFVRFDAAAGPVNNSAVTSYFVSKWGPGCVEEALRLEVPVPTTKKPEFLFGQLVFSGLSFLQLVVPADSLAMFDIGGRIMWGWTVNHDMRHL